MFDAFGRLFEGPTVDAISVIDDDLLPFANGKVDPFYGDSIEPALDFLRDQIKSPQLEVARAKPARVPTDDTHERSPDEIYGIAVLVLEGKGWKIDDEKRKKLLEILGKSEGDVIPVYLMD